MGVIGNQLQQGPGGDAQTQVVLAAMKVLLQPGISQHVIQVMQSVNDPATGLAQATLMIMKGLWDNSKGTIPQNVLVPAAQQVMQYVAQLGEAAGLFKGSPALIKQAMAKAIQMFMQENGVSAQDVQAQMRGGAPAPASAAAAPKPAAPAPTGA